MFSGKIIHKSPWNHHVSCLDPTWNHHFITMKSRFLLLRITMWQCVKTLYPCSSHQNSWDLWMSIPLKMVSIGIDPYPCWNSTDFEKFHGRSPWPVAWPPPHVRPHVDPVATCGFVFHQQNADHGGWTKKNGGFTGDVLEFYQIYQQKSWFHRIELI